MKATVGVVLFVVLVPIILLILSFPAHPVTIAGWAVWIVFGFPLILLGDYLAGKILGDKLGRKIEPNISHVSAKRLFYGTLIAVFVVAIVILLAEILPSGFHEFLDKNYSDEW